MPELPEVETIRRALRASLPGFKVLDTMVRETRLRRPVRPPSLRKLEGQRFVDVGRRAKYLLLWTDADQALVVHLGMTGRVDLFTPPDVPLRTHDHIRWRLGGEGGAVDGILRPGIDRNRTMGRLPSRLRGVGT